MTAETLTVAALFVHERGRAALHSPSGTYWDLPGVDPWPESRDARLYRGPHPVVAHPPCERWSKQAHRWVAEGYFALGDDGGCFASALASVRRWGGVLEHPEGSAAFAAHRLCRPLGPLWTPAGDGVGWVAAVEQGHFGHPGRKPTWLYCAGCRSLPRLPSGPSVGRPVANLSNSRVRGRTPPAFRDFLVGLAARCSPPAPVFL